MHKKTSCHFSNNIPALVISGENNNHIELALIKTKQKKEIFRRHNQNIELILNYALYTNQANIKVQLQYTNTLGPA